MSDLTFNLNDHSCLHHIVAMGALRVCLWQSNFRLLRNDDSESIENLGSESRLDASRHKIILGMSFTTISSLYPDLSLIGMVSVPMGILEYFNQSA